MDEPLTLLEVIGASLIGMLLTEAILQDVSLIGHLIGMSLICVPLP
jgi:hypothetical protein